MGNLGRTVPGRTRASHGPWPPSRAAFARYEYAIRVPPLPLRPLPSSPRASRTSPTQPSPNGNPTRKLSSTPASTTAPGQSPAQLPRPGDDRIGVSPWSPCRHAGFRHGDPGVVVVWLLILAGAVMVAYGMTACCAKGHDRRPPRVTSTRTSPVRAQTKAASSHSTIADNVRPVTSCLRWTPRRREASVQGLTSTK